jgi:membrane-bound serine protease (ClpP class)
MGGMGLSFVVLAAISFQVLPLNWGAFGLMVIGAVLVILEIYITSYGVLGISGLAAFVMGSLFLFHEEGGFISIEYSVLLSTLAGVVFAVGIIVWFLFKDRKAPVPGNFFLPVGTAGLVMTGRENNYQIKVKGEIWNAYSKEALLQGDTVRVTGVDAEKLLLHIQKDKESL